MANWGQKVYPSDYSEIKALLKAEIGRRGKTEGTARGQSVGSMASYNGSAYDFSTQPKAGAYIKNEHIQKITKPLDAIKGTSTTPGNGVQITASRLSQAAAVLSEPERNPGNRYIKRVCWPLFRPMFYGMQYGLHELYRLLYWELHRVLRGIVRQ